VAKILFNRIGEAMNISGASGNPVQLASWTKSVLLSCAIYTTLQSSVNTVINPIIATNL